jgi:2-oxoisovalerate dehydrogenase E1 component
VAESVARTHRLLIVDEAYAMCGIGAELAQAMNELAFDELDAPVGRLHSEALTHPLAPSLEQAMLVDPAKIVAAARRVLQGVAPVPNHWRSIAARSSPATALDAAVTPRPASVPPADTRARQSPPPATAAHGGEPITMPFGDLTVSEGKIVRWAKVDGDAVKRGELVAEIETDKAVVEIEAPAAGRLAIELPVGTVVPMGGRIGTVRES